jgi:branched-chain amino acid transport system ATP-binding protein
VTTGLLEARGLVRRHGGLVAVDHVDLTAAPGRVTAVIGPNGAGKTTLFDCLSGVQEPDEGSVLLDGDNLRTLGSDGRSRLGLIRTFQHSSVFATLTVEENLLVGAENRRPQAAARSILGLRDHDARRAASVVDDVLRASGLTAIRDMPAGALPTGTLRLVELARALCAQPAVLLLDEPASGLDDREVDRLVRRLRALADGGLTLLLVEHDIDLVMQLADEVYAVAAGRVLASGAPGDVVRRPDVRTIVLGES